MPTIRSTRRSIFTTPQATTPQAPGLIAKAAGAASSALRWVTVGMPARSPQQVAEILEICRTCEHFRETRKGTPKCSFCGCYLQAKVSMATESCPLAEPKWTAETASPEAALPEGKA